MRFDWSGWPRSQWALRALVLVGPILALLARWPTWGAPPVWLLVLTLLLATGWAMVPDSIVGALALLVVGLSWSAGLDQRLPPGALVAAGAMLLAHVAAVLASYGPPRLPVAASLVRLWSIRGALLLGAAPLAWLLARGVAELPGDATVWVLGLAVALSVTVVAAAATQLASSEEG